MTAWYAKDENMLNAYNEGKDLYAVIAQAMYGNEYWENLEFYPEGYELELDGQKIICGKKTHTHKAGKERRSSAKTLLLALLYGMSDKTMGMRMGKTEAEGAALRKNFFDQFPNVEQLMKDSRHMLKTKGYVTDWAGRRRRLPDFNLPAYEVSALKKTDEASFNPFLGCEDKPAVDPAVIAKWTALKEQAVRDSQDKQRERCAKNGVKWVENDEMSNAAYEKLAQEARKEGVLITANTGRRAQAERQCLNARIQGCLSYDQFIYTHKGAIKIGELSNQEITVWDGADWSSAIVLPSGKKQKCILTTTTGQQVICSPDHKFLVSNTYGTQKFKKLSELSTQDRLIHGAKAPKFTEKVLFRELLNVDYSGAHNTHNYSFDDIVDDYIRGQVLGRIASDGSCIKRADGSGYIYLFIAEHEQELLEFFRKNLPYKYSTSIEQKKNQKIYRLIISSRTLSEEFAKLNLKHSVPECFFRNSELLRGFISGFFDGDGTSNNDRITLDFGMQSDFTGLCTAMQKALSIFGIKSTIAKYKDRHRVSIRKYEAQLFAERISFINSTKQQKALAIKTLKTNKTFNGAVVSKIKSIEYTDELVDMYDVCNTERGYFVVNGLVTHNSAASLTKLAMVNVHNDEELKSLDAHLVITVHDEVLVECPLAYAEQVEKRLPQVMIDTAKPFFNVPMACDPYAERQWYIGEYSTSIQAEFKKLEEKGVGKEEALAKVIANHPEMFPEAIRDTIETGEEIDTDAYVYSDEYIEDFEIRDEEDDDEDAVEEASPYVSLFE